MSNTHPILYNYLVKGGYKKFRTPLLLNSNNEIVAAPPEIITSGIDKKYEGWESIGSDSYNELINYLNTPRGYDDVLTLLTYYDNTVDSKHKYKLYINFLDEYKLTCIAFTVEYDRLRSAFGSDLDKFHKHNYWDVLYDFINKTVCVGFVNRKSKDQKWIKTDYLEAMYGIQILKIYAPFLYSDRRSLRSDVKSLMKGFDLDSLQKCKMQGGGSSNNIFEYKYLKYNSKLLKNY